MYICWYICIYASTCSQQCIYTGDGDQNGDGDAGLGDDGYWDGGFDGDGDGDTDGDGGHGLDDNDEGDGDASGDCDGDDGCGCCDGGAALLVMLLFLFGGPRGDPEKILENTKI